MKLAIAELKKKTVRRFCTIWKPAMTFEGDQSEKKISEAFIGQDFRASSREKRKCKDFFTFPHYEPWENSE